MRKWFHQNGGIDRLDGRLAEVLPVSVHVPSYSWPTERARMFQVMVRS